MTSSRADPARGTCRRHVRAAVKAMRVIELYSQSFRYSTRQLTDRGRAPVLDELTRHAVAAWLAELAEPSTVDTQPRGMRRFCRWLVAGGELEVASTDGIEIPAPPGVELCGLQLTTSTYEQAREEWPRSSAGSRQED
jgi:hypothetical protein